MKVIDHIGVLVDNLEEAEAFLADVLELDPGKKLNTPEEGFRASFFLGRQSLLDSGWGLL
jgi:catechol 2,3-dioxygenase-like lactoylglutathione lyase family enzyme